MTPRDRKIALAIRAERTCTNWPQMDALAKKLARALGLKGPDAERFVALSYAADGMKW